MPAVTSRIPAAQNALKELLRTTRPNLADYPIDVGSPPGGPEPTHIWISGGVEDWTQQWETTQQPDGHGIKEEKFTLTVCIVVARSDPFEDVRDIAFEIAGEVSQLVLAYRTLDGAVFSAELAGDFDLTHGVIDTDGTTATAVAITLPIAVVAYLQL